MIEDLKPAFTMLALLCAGSVLLAADVKTDYNHNAHFSQVHTYSWGEIKTANPLYVEHIKDEIDKDLQARGWNPVPSGGDAIVFAQERVHNQQELETFYKALNGG